VTVQMSRLFANAASTAAMMLASAAAAQVQPTPPANTQPVDAAPGPTPSDGTANGSGDNGEIVVTAQRRSQVARDVPVALSALDLSATETLKLTDVTTLTEVVPGISAVYQGVLQPFVVIRGISSNSVGIGGEASVGIFIDEAYNGRISAQGVPFLDVERVEILRGPQGSLYGRNSTAGAISVITNKPRFDAFGADLTGSYGSFESYEATAAVNLPVSEKVAARLALLTRGDGGFNRNVTTGSRDQTARIYAGRLSLAAEPSPEFKAYLSVSYSSENAGGLPFKTTVPDLAAASNVDTDPFSRKFAQSFDGNEKRRALGANLTLSYDFSEQIMLKSVTSYSETRYGGLYDIDGSALPLQELGFEGGRITSFGQELRLNVEKGPFRIAVGANAFFEQVRQTSSLTFDDNVLLPLVTAGLFGLPDGTVPADTLGPGSPAFIPCDPTSVVLFGVPCSTRQREALNQSGRYRSLAAFIDAELKLSDTLTFTTGGRYSIDRKRFSYNTPLVVSQGSLLAGTNLLLRASTNGEERVADTWKDFQPRFVLRWQPTRLLNIYGSATRGFKSGGFDPAARNGVYDPALTKFQPETVWSYELGLKASFFDRKADLNLAGYRYNYRGFQVQVLRDGITSTLNVPQYNAWGAEADLTLRPNKMITLLLGGAYNSATFGNFLVDDRFNPGQQQNLRGNRGILSPELSLFARADGVIPLSDKLQLRLAGDVNWRSRQFFTIFGDLRESQAPYALVGAEIGIGAPDEAWSVAINARNLLNKAYLTSSVEQGFGISTFRGRPRSISLDLRAKF
jgi:iron complex outermembrane recepter protein